MAANANFALAPALLPQDAGFINYATTEGRKLYKDSTEALSDTKFDGKNDNIALFKEQLLSRALTCGWNNEDANIIDLPDDMDDNNANFYNIVNQPGMLSIDILTQWANADIVNEETRLAQNNFQMYQCLSASINDKMKKRLLAKQDIYIINDTPIAAIYYKLLMSKCQLDTKATVASIREKIRNLDQSIVTKFDCNIKEFNEYVDGLVEGLEARGETISDLLTTLFQAYKKVDDASFKKAIEIKEDSWLHGEADNMTYTGLMAFAEHDYDIRVDRGTFREPTEDQKQIVALQATINSLKSNNGNNSQQTKKNKKKKKKKSDQDKDTESDADTKPKKKKSDDQWAWKKVKPQDTSIPKVFNGKTYYWCPKHNAFTLHKPEECRLGDDTSNNSSNGNSNNDTKSSYAAALATIEEDFSDEE